MKCNWKEIALWSNQKSTIEGRLNYKKVHAGSYLNPSIFKERWFRLVKNYLIYYKINETGTFNTNEPAGIIVMENSSVKVEQRNSIPFAFSISFLDDSEKVHVFAARSEENVRQWVDKLSTCNYEFLRSRLYTLQSRLFELTGKDPLLMVPRNEGAQLWRPSAPFSAAPACSKSFGFCCHLHTSNNAFTLQKSFSSGNFYVPLNPGRCHDIIGDGGRCEILQKYERSHTTDLCKNPSENAVVYNRAAPSPPTRKKNSPRVQRNDMASGLSVEGKNLSVNGIANGLPKPPRRKVSPVLLAKSNDPSGASITNAEDLIKF